MAIKTVIRDATPKEISEAKKRQEKKNPKPAEAQPVEKPKPAKVQPVEKLKVKKGSLDDLRMIEGIGEETLDDIKKIYKSVDELIVSLKEDKVPLRNDIVQKLKNKLL